MSAIPKRLPFYRVVGGNGKDLVKIWINKQNEVYKVGVRKGDQTKYYNPKKFVEAFQIE